VNRKLREIFTTVGETVASTRYLAEDASLWSRHRREKDAKRESRENSSRTRENAARRLRGRNSHYGMDGRAQEV